MYEKSFLKVEPSYLTPQVKFLYEGVGGGTATCDMMCSFRFVFVDVWGECVL